MTSDGSGELPGGEPDRADELRVVLRSSPWFDGVMRSVRTVGPPDWWIGAGVIRDIVWDTRFGNGFAPERVKDVDVAYFDPANLGPDRDVEVEQLLTDIAPQIRWDAKNQAAVHLWYPQRFGRSVPPNASITDAVATWPEYAVCVAVNLTDDETLQVCAPHGLDDLLDGVWRHNPCRASRQEYLRRLDAKSPSARWPSVRVAVEPGAL